MKQKEVETDRVARANECLVVEAKTHSACGHSWANYLEGNLEVLALTTRLILKVHVLRHVRTTMQDLNKLMRNEHKLANLLIIIVGAHVSEHGISCHLEDAFLCHLDGGVNQLAHRADHTVQDKPQEAALSFHTCPRIIEGVLDEK